MIKVDHRYFCGFGKSGQPMLAWSLAGAQLFIDDRVAESVMESLKSKGKKPQLLVVVLEVQS
ncbi:hypothetical protein ABT56_23110 [Photobacterium aquae]|uniref:Uncharacterized protein n=1 Tax=Photobacterium aquae TaxID=1195763 RepID=A0A0J1GGW2_9GAMM|nr:hypothetical protein [Photobacterium aquae]KLU98795.1 hypothetical protein ABT56_23110 [Photobacterium aquae]